MYCIGFGRFPFWEPTIFVIIITAPTNADFRYINTASDFLQKNFQKSGTFLMFLFPLLYRGIICIALVLRYRVLFLCPENKTQVEKTGKEAFDALGMKLYCYEN